MILLIQILDQQLRPDELLNKILIPTLKVLTNIMQLNGWIFTNLISNKMKNFAFIVCLIFVSCNQKKEIKKLGIYYIGCLGECPQFKIEIEPNGAVKYYGGYFSQKKGFYTGVIDSKTWNKIEDFLIKGDYKNLKRSYYLSTDEEMNVELVIESEKVKKRTTGLIVHYPTEIKKLLEFVLQEVPNWKMTKTKDSLNFDFISDDYMEPKFPPQPKSK